MRQLLPEWTAQDAILLAWPHAHSDWAANLDAIEAFYCDLIAVITRFERVLVICHDENVQREVAARLAERAIDLHKVILHTLPCNDTWLRDSGPIGVQQDSKLMLADFRFNGWGGKFDARLDDAITRTLAAQKAFAAPVQSYPLFLEGGSLDCDGAGTLLTTTQCLLTPTRNPAMSRQDYEAFFAAEFGIERVLWLTRGELQGDDTDGHVDMLARFCNPTTIAYTSCERPEDAHYAPLRAMEDELKAFVTADGTPYTLVPLPIPQPIHDVDGERLPASYANFLVLNQAVLVPVYADRNDDRVLASLQACFPGHEIIGLDARVVIEQHGSLHCLTMQLPAGSLVAE